jgi:hypothetical protein
MRVDDLDIMITNEVRDLQSAQYPKRVSDRNVKDVLGRQKRKTMLPIAGRPQCDEYFMSARRKVAGEIDQMSLGPAVVSRG